MCIRDRADGEGAAERFLDAFGDCSVIRAGVNVQAKDRVCLLYTSDVYKRQVSEREKEDRNAENAARGER